LFFTDTRLFTVTLDDTSEATDTSVQDHNDEALNKVTAVEGKPLGPTYTHKTRNNKAQRHDKHAEDLLKKAGLNPDKLVKMEKEHRGKLLDILLTQLQEELDLRMKLANRSLSDKEAAELRNKTFFLDKDIKAMVKKLRNESNKELKEAEDMLMNHKKSKEEKLRYHTGESAETTDYYAKDITSTVPLSTETPDAVSTTRKSSRNKLATAKISLKAKEISLDDLLKGKKGHAKDNATLLPPLAAEELKDDPLSQYAVEVNMEHLFSTVSSPDPDLPAYMIPQPKRTRENKGQRNKNPDFQGQGNQKELGDKGKGPKIFPVAIIKKTKADGEEDQGFNFEKVNKVPSFSVLKDPKFQKQLLNEVSQQMSLKRCKQKGALSLEDSVVAIEVYKMMKNEKSNLTTATAKLHQTTRTATTTEATKLIAVEEIVDSNQAIFSQEDRVRRIASRLADKFAMHSSASTEGRSSTLASDVVANTTKENYVDELPYEVNNIEDNYRQASETKAPISQGQRVTGTADNESRSKVQAKFTSLEDKLLEAEKRKLKILEEMLKQEEYEVSKALQRTQGEKAMNKGASGDIQLSTWLPVKRASPDVSASPVIGSVLEKIKMFKRQMSRKTRGKAVVRKKRSVAVKGGRKKDVSSKSAESSELAKRISWLKKRALGTRGLGPGKQIVRHGSKHQVQQALKINAEGQAQAMSNEAKEYALTLAPEERLALAELLDKAVEGLKNEGVLTTTSKCWSPQAQTTDMILEQAHYFASQTPTLTFLLVITKCRKFVIQGFV
jgi:hypothetical protein